MSDKLNKNNDFPKFEKIKINIDRNNKCNKIFVSNCKSVSFSASSSSPMRTVTYRKSSFSNFRKV